MITRTTIIHSKATKPDIIDKTSIFCYFHPEISRLHQEPERGVPFPRNYKRPFLIGSHEIFQKF